MFEGEVVVMYVQIQNPDPEFANEYESWACSADYQMINTEYVGQVFNYQYGTTLLDNDATERSTYNVKDQTFDHPEYSRNGPWLAGNALQWYTQTYSIEDNYSALTCTAVRQYGEGQKGFFDMPAGSSVTVNMGYRVYENAEKTRARIHHDYPGILFDLLPEGTIPR